MTPKPNTDDERAEYTGGLYQKYEVLKDGEPQDGCFVLKPESDTVARRALIRYAELTDDEELAQDLRDWIAQIEIREVRD